MGVPPCTNFNFSVGGSGILTRQARNFHQIIGGGGGGLDEQNLSFTILLLLRLSEYIGGRQQNR